MKKEIDLMYEIGSLKNVQRGWRQHMGMDVATILEHSFRVMYIALILARMEKVKNEEKIMKMVLIHDMAETRVSDLSYVQKVYVNADEERAVKDMFEGTILADLERDILHEYEERKSIESKIVKDADNLDIDIELKELSTRGARLAKEWPKFRKMIRDKKLYTKSAKKLWDIIQKSDPHDWHVNINKWVKMPNAGK
jgi:putative hydrolase of HD superfamily